MIMVTFLLYTVMALLANAGMAMILYISLQQGQWLDKLLNWQHRLQLWDMEGKEFLAKAGGYCELCFSHFITFVGFWPYAFFMNYAADAWVTDNVASTGIAVLINITWYLFYVSIGTNLTLYFITRLFQK